MGLYLKKFENHTDYEAFTATSEFIKPNVSYCEQENEVHYNPYVHDYSQDYLTFEALEDGIFQFTNAINYSVDNGTTWVALAEDTATPTITSGNKIMWKAELTPSFSYPLGIGTFSSTGNFDVEGNPMSLLYSNNFIGQTGLTEKNGAFYKLFSNCSKLINAKNLSLPATALAISCYTNMFYNCTNLTTAPQLPATTLASGCYGDMFYNCTNLTTAPQLPATTLASGCYGDMFNGCTSLTTAPSILPATTLADYCYLSMFQNCTSLTTAPQLPATTLAQYCYQNMFNGCTSLNYIKAMFTTTPSTTYTAEWVNGVAASGTFVKNSAATWTTTGVNGVPSGWTVETASA